MFAAPSRASRSGGNSNKNPTTKGQPSKTWAHGTPCELGGGASCQASCGPAVDPGCPDSCFFLGRFQSNDVQPLSSLVHRCLVTHPKKLRTEGLSRPLIFKVFGTNSQFLLVLDNTLGAAYSVAQLCPCNKFQISIINHNKYHT